MECPHVASLGMIAHLKSLIPIERLNTMLDDLKLAGMHLHWDGGHYSPNIDPQKILGE
jgi:hypothetical protein